jgi:hypothetical protein
MKRTAVFMVAFCAACPVYAIWTSADRGTWPKTWPAELEPLRKQSRTIRGSEADLTQYKIPFTKREEFESAWSHLLKVKSKGSPIILVRSPLEHWSFGKMDAGVIVHCPPGHPETDHRPAQTGQIQSSNLGERWMWTFYIELAVDGKIVDLNRIPLPADTPIIDQRFEEGGVKASRVVRGPTAWGEAVGGLQAGLGLREQRAYRLGEAITLVVRVRNVGKDTVKFQYIKQFLDERPPTVTGADGKIIPQGGVAVLGFHVPVEVTLEPGEEIELDSRMHGAGGRRYELSPTGGGKLTKASWPLLVGSGKIGLQYERVFGNSSAGSAGLDPKLSKLATGMLELEIDSDRPGPR